MDNHKIWDLIEEAWDLIKKRYEPVIEREVDRLGLDLRTGRLLVSVYLTELEASSFGVTPADLMVRNPYTSADAYIARLSATAEKGYLEEIQPSSYRLTEAGKSMTHHLVETARSEMARHNPLPQEDAQRLANYLHRLVQCCINVEPPPDTWGISTCYKLMPAGDNLVAFIEQCITCLSAYREDAHLAAWMTSNLSATTFETLTLFWRLEVCTLDDAFEKLAYRGHPRVTYEQAFDELWERGFIYDDEDGPHLTEEGRLFRNEIEFETERYFYKPWDCLSDPEKFELGGLLIRMRDGFKVLQE